MTVAATSWLHRRRAAILVGGAMVVGDSYALAGSEITWAVLVVGTDFVAAFAAVLTAFGASLFAHMVYRLHNVEIT